MNIPVSISVCLGWQSHKWKARRGKRKWEVGSGKCRWTGGWGPKTSNLKHLMTKETEQPGARPGQRAEDTGLGRAVGDPF